MFRTAKQRWRYGFLALALFCWGSVAFALILQFQDIAPPCPLCIFQRIGVMACGAMAALAACFPPRGAGWAWPALLTLAGGAGALRALAQIPAGRASITCCRWTRCRMSLPPCSPATATAR